MVGTLTNMPCGLTRQSTGPARKAAQAGDFERYAKGNGDAR